MISMRYILRCKKPKQTQRHRSLHIGKTQDQHLEACCRGISSCWAGENPKLPSSHRHCCQYLNGAKLCLSDLHNDDSRFRSAGCSLTAYPRLNFHFSLIEISKKQKKLYIGINLIFYPSGQQESHYEWMNKSFKTISTSLEFIRFRSNLIRSHLLKCVKHCYCRKWFEMLTVCLADWCLPYHWPKKPASSI